MSSRIVFFSRLANQHFDVVAVDDKGNIQYEQNPATGQYKFIGSKKAHVTLSCSFATVNSIPSGKGCLSDFQVIVDPDEPYHKRLLEDSGEPFVLSPGVLIGTKEGAKHPQFEEIVKKLYKIASPSYGSSVMTEEAYRKTENPEAYAKAMEAAATKAELERLKAENEALRNGKSGSEKQNEEQAKRLKELGQKSQ